MKKYLFLTSALVAFTMSGVTDKEKENEKILIFNISFGGFYDEWRD